MSLQKYSANLPLIQTLPFLIETHGRFENNRFSEILKVRGGRF